MKNVLSIFGVGSRRWVMALIVGSTLALIPRPALSKDGDQEKKAGSVRVYRFDNLDIEGNVKTPQLMYFLKRIRNKFHSFRLTEPKFKEKIIQTKSDDFL